MMGTIIVRVHRAKVAETLKEVPNSIYTIVRPHLTETSESGRDDSDSSTWKRGHRLYSKPKKPAKATRWGFSATVESVSSASESEDERKRKISQYDGACDSPPGRRRAQTTGGGNGEMNSPHYFPYGYPYPHYAPHAQYGPAYGGPPPYMEDRSPQTYAYGFYGQQPYPPYGYPYAPTGDPKAGKGRFRLIAHCRNNC